MKFFTLFMTITLLLTITLTIGTLVGCSEREEDNTPQDKNTIKVTRTEELVTGLRHPTDIALDVAGGKMYWTDDALYKLQRANLDGSNIETLLTGWTSHELKFAGGKLYWIKGKTIQRANLDGSNIEDIVTAEAPSDIAVDVAGGKIYWVNWTDSFTDQIQRANLDGSNIEAIVTVEEPEGSITIDAAGGKIYWTAYHGLTLEKVQRANLDGSDVQDLFRGPRYSIEIAVDAAREKFYWIEVHGNIRCSNLDGSNEQGLVDTGTVQRAGRFALDVTGHKLYWTSGDTYNIQRAHLDYEK